VGVESWIDWDLFGANVLAWLCTYALHSTVLIGGAWLVAVALARLACRMRALRDLLPAIRERLWKVALVGGLVTATAQSWFHVGPWQLRFGPDRTHSVLVGTPGAPSMLPELSPAALVTTPADALARDDGGASATEPRTAALVEPAGFHWVGIVLSLWALGVAFGLARWICQWNRLLRDIDDRAPIRSGVVFEQFSRLRAESGARSPVALSSAPMIAAPISLGIFRAEICVPPRVEHDLRREEVATLLAHELAHVERRDPAWLVLCRAIEVVFFFQPLNRWCAQWLSDEAEYLSDDWAVMQTGERVGMASCLTEIAGWLVQSDEPRLVAGMAARGTRLSLRVGRLLDLDHEPATTARGTWLTSAFAPFGLSAVLLVPGVTTEDEEARVENGLGDRTTVLELALAGMTENRVEPVVVTVNAVAPAQDANIEDVLGALDDEILKLRADLATRAGGEPIRLALDNLERRVTELRSRARAVQSALADFTAAEWSASSAASPPSNVFAIDSVFKD
jgi:beta-lactamase regulating signal transducer with metallopeptidase domain